MQKLKIMKARKRILNIRKQSRIGSPKHDLWFFSEDTGSNQSPNAERKSSMKDRLSILNNDYSREALRSSELKRNKKECTFVVDWQMTDTF